MNKCKESDQKIIFSSVLLFRKACSENVFRKAVLKIVTNWKWSVCGWNYNATGRYYWHLGERILLGLCWMMLVILNHFRFLEGLIRCVAHRFSQSDSLFSQMKQQVFEQVDSILWQWCWWLQVSDHCEVLPIIISMLVTLFGCSCSTPM